MQRGYDPTEIKSGVMITEIWDDVVVGEDDVAKSCHCAFRIDAWEAARPISGAVLLRVIAHDLLPGDVVKKAEARRDKGGCHCDVYFTVFRSPDVDHLPVGTRVSHVSQKWHRPSMGGTATVIGIKGPYTDGSVEYRVAAGLDLSRHTGTDNPEHRDAWWSSLATRKAER